MGLFSMRKTSNDYKDHVQMIYPFKMSQGALSEIAKGFNDSVRDFGGKLAVDFFYLAVMLFDNPSVYKPEKPFLYKPINEKDCYIQRPLGEYQVQFTIITIQSPYTYKEGGRSSKLRIDEVLLAFEKGNFPLPSALRLPLIKMRMDPFTPQGTWYPNEEEVKEPRVIKK